MDGQRTLLPPLSSSAALERVPWNLQENQSLPEQGTNGPITDGISISAPIKDEPQKLGVVLALHHLKGVKEKARGSLDMLKEHLTQYFPAGPVLQSNSAFSCYHTLRILCEQNDQDFLKLWWSVFLTVTKDTVSH